MYIVLSTSTVFKIIHDAFRRVYRKLKRLEQRIKRPEELDRITSVFFSSTELGGTRLHLVFYNYSIEFDMAT